MMYNVQCTIYDAHVQCLNVRDIIYKKVSDQEKKQSLFACTYIVHFT